MFSHGITASSSSSVAAVSSAVAEASADFGGDAKSVHIIVTSVTELDGVWVANVLVLVTPDLDEVLEKDFKKEREQQEPHLNKKKDEELDLDDLLEFDEDGVGIHIYFPMDLEDHMNAFEHDMIIDPKLTQSDDFYFHLIDEGPLWRAVEEHPLDIEFYEATHTEELKTRQEKDSRQFQQHMKAPRAQNKMHGGLQDLEPE